MTSFKLNSTDSYLLSAYFNEKTQTIRTTVKIQFPIKYRGLISVEDDDGDYYVHWLFPFRWVGFLNYTTSSHFSSHWVKREKIVNGIEAQQINGESEKQSYSIILNHLGKFKMSYPSLTLVNENNSYIKTRTNAKTDRPLA